MINRDIVKYVAENKPNNEISALTIAEDFGRAFLQSALVSPLWNGLGQLLTQGYLPQLSIANLENAQSSIVDSWSQKIGGALGLATDFFLLSKLGGKVLKQHVDLKNSESASLGQMSLNKMKEGARWGALYGAVFEPSDQNENLVGGRLANAVSQGLTFGLLGGGAAFMGGFKPLFNIRPNTLLNASSDMAIAGIVGIPAGIIGMTFDATLHGRQLTLDDVKQSAVDYGIVGIGLAGLSHGVRYFGSKPTITMPKEGKLSPDKEASRLEPTAPPPQDISLLAKPTISPIQPNIKPESIAASRRSVGPTMLDLELPKLRRDELSEAVTKLARVELPSSLTPRSSSSQKFLSERAWALEARELELAKQADLSNTKLGDQIVGIKRYINDNGTPAEKYLPDVIKRSDITIIGETHAYYNRSPHIELGVRTIEKLPAGSILAVEVPRSLKFVFEEFNHSPKGSEFQIPAPTASYSKDMQLTLKTLESEIIKPKHQILDLWKAARDRRIRVEPIDAERWSGVNVDKATRESEIAKNLLALMESSNGKPVVAWLGNYHAAKTTGVAVMPAAQRIAETPQFVDGKRKLSTVFSQVSNPEQGIFEKKMHYPLRIFASGLKESIAVPIAHGKNNSGFGNIGIIGKSDAREIFGGRLRISDFDHVLLYPYDFIRDFQSLGKK